MASRVPGPQELLPADPDTALAQLAGSFRPAPTAQAPAVALPSSRGGCHGRDPPCRKDHCASAAGRERGHCLRRLAPRHSERHRHLARHSHSVTDGQPSSGAMRSLGPARTWGIAFVLAGGACHTAPHPLSRHRPHRSLGLLGDTNPMSSSPTMTWGPRDCHREDVPQAYVGEHARSPQES